MKKKVTVICVIVILIAILACGTYAAYTVKGITTNVITMGTVKLDLTEKELNQGELIGYINGKKDILPGQKVSKVPIVENTGTEPFYTRMRIEIEAVASDGETPLSTDCVKLWLDKANWTLKDNWFLDQADWVIEADEDGNVWYYYNGVVEPGQKVAPFNIVEFTGAMDNSYLGATITITLQSQAVQTKHNDIPAGGDITDVAGWPKTTPAA